MDYIPFLLYFVVFSKENLTKSKYNKYLTSFTLNCYDIHTAMDPKQQLSQLDPKLKEAYERVMSSSATPTVPSTSPAPTATVNPPTPTSVPMPNINTSTASGPFPTPGISTTPPPMPTMSPNINSSGMSPQMTAAPITNISPTPTVVNPGSPTPAPTTGPVKVQFNAQIGNPTAAQPATTGMGLQAQKKKGPKVSPALIIVAGIVFILAYAIFWMKVFNIPIPFLG
jgi:hypothetical protein